MKNFKFSVLCTFNLILAFSATLFPLKSIYVFAESSTSPPVCKDGYEYVESVGKCYKKCQEGQERNPETNRCRKIQTKVTAPSPATDSPSASGSNLPSKAAAEPASTTEPVSTTDPPSVTENTSTIASCKDGYEYVESVGKCYKKCQEGQERNPETNRCRKIQIENSKSSEGSSSTSKISAKNAPASCKDGYEYVASANKCYKACSDGQIRNPETNRCKKASSAQTEAKECQEGYERNPETNRCRKIKKNTGADYDIDVPNTGGVSGSFVAGGAIIALVAAGAIFVVFQYRQEIKSFFKKRFKKA